MVLLYSFIFSLYLFSFIILEFFNGRFFNGNFLMEISFSLLPLFFCSLPRRHSCWLSRGIRSGRRRGCRHQPTEPTETAACRRICPGELVARAFNFGYASSLRRWSFRSGLAWRAHLAAFDRHHAPATLSLPCCNMCHPSAFGGPSAFVDRVGEPGLSIV